MTELDLLRASTARYLAERYPLSEVRRLAEARQPLPAAHRRQAGALGWFASVVPEEHGGGTVAGPMRDAVALAIERGRALHPLAVVPSIVAAAALVRASDEVSRREILPAIAAGELAVAWAIANVTGSYEPVSAVRAERKDDGYVLNGRAGLVDGGASCDLLLVTAATEAGASQFLLPAATNGVVVEPAASLDLTRSFATIDFVDVAAPCGALVGSADARGSEVDDQLHLAALLTAAETMGTARALFDLTRAYAADRIAFGRPIGSFQAIKHALADASLAVETATVAVLRGADAFDDAQADGHDIVNLAAAFVGDAMADVAQTCHQVHGGIGFTWEHDLHLFLRRIASDRALYGDPAWHRERLCRRHGL